MTFDSSLRKDGRTWIFDDGTGRGKSYFYSDAEVFRAASESSWRGEELRRHLIPYISRGLGLTPSQWRKTLHRYINEKLRDEKNLFLALSVLRDA